MGPQAEHGAVRRVALAVRHYATLTLQRYRKLHVYGKVGPSLKLTYARLDTAISDFQVAVVALILFYIALITAILVVTPARIAQALYDVAQDFSSRPYGWILLMGLVGTHFGHVIYL